MSIYNQDLMSKQALDVMLRYQFETVLDVGCGNGKYSEYLKKRGKRVTSTDFIDRYHSTVVGDYMQLYFEQRDAVWCAHVLEHMLDTHSFLKKLISEVKEGGVIAITVPPLKHQIVGGHVCLWNAGLLLYRMVLAGLDCSNASVGVYDYNISVVVQKKTIDLPQLKMGKGDIEALAQYFPIPVKQGFDGKDINVRWI